MYVEETRTAPCTEDASSLMNLSVDWNCYDEYTGSVSRKEVPTYSNSIQTPFDDLLAKTPAFDMPR